MIHSPQHHGLFRLNKFESAMTSGESPTLSWVTGGVTFSHSQTVYTWIMI